MEPVAIDALLDVRWYAGFWDYKCEYIFSTSFERLDFPLHEEVPRMKGKRVSGWSEEKRHFSFLSSMVVDVLVVQILQSWS